MSEQQAAGLARAVAEALRAWPAPQSAIRLQQVTATVAAAPSTSGAEQLAHQIASAVMRTAIEAGA